ncbi:MAG: carbohydrate-binding family 9-like protein [Sarcina sp.]
MKFIKKCNAENFSWDNIENNVIGNFPWDSTGYTPKTTVKVAVLEEGLKVKFTGTEKEVIINNTELHSRVYQDSCVEFFVNPDFENSNDYINIEINALGTALSQIGPDAIEREFLTAGDIRSLNITTDITSENVREFDGFKPWNLEYLISFDLIEKYYPKFDRNNLKSIKCNFYKCGDKTKEKHYGCLFNIKYHKPSFHRPEFFKEILVK